VEFLCCLLPVFICAPLFVDTARAVKGTFRTELWRAFLLTAVAGSLPALVVMVTVDVSRLPSPPWLLVPLDWVAAVLTLGVVFGAVLGLRLKYAPPEREKVVDPNELKY